MVSKMWNRDLNLVVRCGVCDVNFCVWLVFFLFGVRWIFFGIFWENIFCMFVKKKKMLTGLFNFFIMGGYL